MPKVKITPNPAYNAIGIRLLLSDIGVQGPMLQDETTITCVMTDEQISRFRNGRGAAHMVEIIPDPPPVPMRAALEINHVESDDEPNTTDPANPEPSEFPKTYGKAGQRRVIVEDAEQEKAIKGAGYKRVDPDPLDAA
jgi:hypothetical protein